MSNVKAQDGLTLVVKRFTRFRQDNIRTLTQYSEYKEMSASFNQLLETLERNVKRIPNVVIPPSELGYKTLSYIENIPRRSFFSINQCVSVLEELNRTIVALKKTLEEKPVEEKPIAGTVVKTGNFLQAYNLVKQKKAVKASLTKVGITYRIELGKDGKVKYKINGKASQLRNDFVEQTYQIYLLEKEVTNNEEVS